MNDERSPITPWIVAGLVIPVVLVAAYVGGYLALSERLAWYEVDGQLGPVSVDREFTNRTFAWLYKPAGKVEEWIAGIPVDVKMESPSPLTGR